MARPTRIGEELETVFHKEKKQKKYNKTKGQYDKLKKYSNDDNLSSAKAATDKQIKREAKFIKNLHIDSTLERLLNAHLISIEQHEQYHDWYCMVMHKLGPQYVLAQGDLALKNARDKNNPAPLFHFLINKAMNKANDDYMPRFN